MPGFARKHILCVQRLLNKPHNSRPFFVRVLDTVGLPCQCCASLAATRAGHKWSHCSTLPPVPPPLWPSLSQGICPTADSGPSLWPLCLLPLLRAGVPSSAALPSARGLRPGCAISGISLAPCPPPTEIFPNACYGHGHLR